MASCAEAVHYYLHCGAGGLDGNKNKNGIPCEDLCVRDRVKGNTEEKKKENVLAHQEGAILYL